MTFASTLFYRIASRRPARILTPGLAICLVLSACGGGGGGGGADGAIGGGTPAPASAAPLPAPAADSSGGTSSAPQTSANTGDTSCGLNAPDGIRNEVLTRVNELRAAGATCGSVRYGAAPALAWNTVLLQAAAGHSGDMATNNYFAHNSQDGRTPPQRLLAAGYSYSNMGENIAAGQSSVESVMKGWQESPGHCKNLLNPAFRDVAVACKANTSSTYGFYWAMELGRSL